jgi:hypothetical protein
MRRAGVAGRMNELCEPDCEIEFARQAISNPECYRALKAVEDALPLHVFGPYKERGPIAEAIFSVIDDVYRNKLKLTPCPYDAEAELSKHVVR